MNDDFKKYEQEREVYRLPKRPSFFDLFLEDLNKFLGRFVRPMLLLMIMILLALLFKDDTDGQKKQKVIGHPKVPVTRPKVKEVEPEEDNFQLLPKDDKFNKHWEVM